MRRTWLFILMRLFLSTRCSWLDLLLMAICSSVCKSECCEILWQVLRNPEDGVRPQLLGKLHMWGAYLSLTGPHTPNKAYLCNQWGWLILSLRIADSWLWHPAPPGLKHSPHPLIPSPFVPFPSLCGFESLMLSLGHWWVNRQNAFQLVSVAQAKRN